MAGHTYSRCEDHPSRSHPVVATHAVEAGVGSAISVRHRVGTHSSRGTCLRLTPLCLVRRVGGSYSYQKALNLPPRRSHRRRRPRSALARRPEWVDGSAPAHVSGMVVGHRQGSERNAGVNGHSQWGGGVEAGRAYGFSQPNPSNAPSRHEVRHSVCVRVFVFVCVCVAVCVCGCVCVWLCVAVCGCVCVRGGARLPRCVPACCSGVHRSRSGHCLLCTTR